MQNLQEKLIGWFKRPEVRAMNWEPTLFWHPLNDRDPFGKPRVDPWEMEVLFATVLGEPAEYFEKLNQRSLASDTHRAMGRADFIAIQVTRHELPLMTRADDVPQ